MNNNITYSNIIDRLNEKNITFKVIELQEGVKIIVSEYGGRVFGPFFAEDDKSTSWTNNIFSDKDSFNDFYNSDQWNLGGDRIWIAPEIQFSVKDRNKFWETLKTPAAIDPGTYTLQMDKDICILQQHMDLEAYNINSGTASLNITRKIRKIENPLRKTKIYKTLDKVIYAGYEQKITLETQNDIYAEAWDLIQLNPGGKIYISSCSNVEYVDYYEEIDSEYQKINQNHVELNLSGNRRYKVGFKSAQIFGRVAYLNKCDDDNYYLIVKCFFNNPSSVYAEEPPAQPGDNGYSVHVYNDDGNFGGFGELECNLQTIGGDTGVQSSTDQILTWFYRGNKEDIENVLLSLMGVSVK